MPNTVPPQPNHKQAVNVKTLILSGHPDGKASFSNRLILEETLRLLPEADLVRLGVLYPDFRIDVAAEQRRLSGAETLVLQFPLYWYGMPALMKKWMEDVCTYGFAHGSTGDKLRGKRLIASFTSGAPEEMYRHGGAQNYTIEEFLPPLRQFACLCGMEWAGHVYSGGYGTAATRDEEKRAVMRDRALDHARRLAGLIAATGA